MAITATMEFISELKSVFERIIVSFYLFLLVNLGNL